MIAFVQPYSTTGKAGGARILQTLLADPGHEWISICTSIVSPVVLGENEFWIPNRPLVKPIDRHTRLQRLLTANLDVIYGGQLERRIIDRCKQSGVTAIHAIPHGIDFWYAYKAAKKLGIKYYLNVHDELYYNLRGVSYLPYAMKRLAEVWRGADHLFVISAAMGEEYNRRYGTREYSVVTDGLSSVAPAAQSRDGSAIRVYMMGSAHISYRDNFTVMLEGLEEVSKRHPGTEVTLTMRGGFPYANSTGIKITELPWGTQEDVENDLANADILYLPLPFPQEYAPLAKYSLATKMVTYLGTGLPILYHGPAYAAAANLLREKGAAILVEENSPVAFADGIDRARLESNHVVERALVFAKERFMVADQREKFWSVLDSITA